MAPAELEEVSLGSCPHEVSQVAILSWVEEAGGWDIGYLGPTAPSLLSLYLNEDQDGRLPFSLLLALQAGQQVAENCLDLFAVILHHGPGGKA